MITEQTLLDIYRATLARATPQRLIRECLLRDELQSLRETEVDLVATGKCAIGLAEGALSILKAHRTFIAVPQGYSGNALQRSENVEIVEGSHPEMSDASFHAGERLHEFVASASRPIVFMISGGSSACAERPLRPWFGEQELMAVNRALIRSGLNIASINLVRRRLSAIKGGRLGAIAPRGSVTMIYSDVSRGRVADVGSGPTLADDSTNGEAASILESVFDESCSGLAERLRDIPDESVRSRAARTFLIADNSTLLTIAGDEAESRGLDVSLLESELEGDVAAIADGLVERVRELSSGTLIVAGGEPAVVVRAHGTGGRCSELAVLFAMGCNAAELSSIALFASSDGLDGNTGAAGVVLSAGATLDRSSVEKALAGNDTFPLARALGNPIVTGATGNNLRDLYLVARN